LFFLNYKPFEFGQSFNERYFHYVNKTFLLYLKWFAISFGILFISVHLLPSKLIRKEHLLSINHLINVFITGNSKELGQIWFLHDMIFGFLIAPLLFFCNRFFLLVVVIISYFFFPQLNDFALRFRYIFFFIVGAEIGINYMKYNKIKPFHLFVFGIILSIITISTSFIFNKTNFAYKDNCYLFFDITTPCIFFCFVNFLLLKIKIPQKLDHYNKQKHLLLFGLQFIYISIVCKLFLWNYTISFGELIISTILVLASCYFFNEMLYHIISSSSIKILKGKWKNFFIRLSNKSI
jgi:hypothetical protein